MCDKWKETKNKIILPGSKDIFDMLLEKQRYFLKGNKADYEKYISDNLNDIFESIGLSAIKEILNQPKYFNGVFINPDLFIKHEDGTSSIIEILCSDNEYLNTAAEQCSTIEQLLLYKSKIKLDYAINPRLFLVAQKIYSKTVCMLLEMQFPITLIEVQNDRVFIPYMKYED